MFVTRSCLVLSCAVLAACAATPIEPQFRSYDLHLHHPSDYATYMMVSPGAQGAKLPKLRHIESRDFSEYMRAATGCVVNATREITPLGNARTPAGYMVPIVCAPMVNPATLRVVPDDGLTLSDDGRDRSDP